MIRARLSGLVILVGFLLVTCTAFASGEEPAPAEPKSQVSKIVFVGQKEACECTRKRIDTTWDTLQTLLDDGFDIKVTRIQRDVDKEDAKKLTKLKPLMVQPGIYFFDKEGELVEMIQGEVKSEDISKVLQKTS